MGYKGTNEKFTFKKLFQAINKSKWSLLVPIIILGGIYGGIFTPTEAAVVAVVYALFVSVFLHKEIKLNDLHDILKNSALSSVAIMIIIGTANAFGNILSMERIPQAFADLFLSISQNNFIILLLIIVMLLIIGLFIDTSAAVIIFTPILFPVAMEIGMDPIHFGIVMITTLAIGFITPPLGVNLFVGSGISGLSIPVLARASIPFFFVLLVGLIVIAAIPKITLLFL